MPRRRRYLVSKGIEPSTDDDAVYGQWLSVIGKEYGEGKTTGMIGEDSGFDRNSIRIDLRKAGIKVRGRGGATRTKACVVDGVEYPSHVAAARALGVSPSKISRSLSKKTKRSKVKNNGKGFGGVRSDARAVHPGGVPASHKPVGHWCSMAGAAGMAVSRVEALHSICKKRGCRKGCGYGQLLPQSLPQNVTILEGA